MKKISSLTSTATSDGLFTNGSVATGVSPTILDAGWFNTVQNELVNIVQGAGLSLDDSNDAQVFEALKKLLLAQNAGRLLGVKVFTASGTYTPTAGTKAIMVEVVGGGGGGGNASASSSSTCGLGVGGGGGGYAKSYLTVVPASASVIVGAGGAAASAGGQSSFNGSIIAYGGNAGSSTLSGTFSNSLSPSNQTSATGGSATGGNMLNVYGGDGITALYTTTGNCVSGGGGSSFFSGVKRGVGGGSSNGMSNSLGGGGSGANANNTTNQYTGGSGGAGIVIVTEYA